MIDPKKLTNAQLLNEWYFENMDLNRSLSPRQSRKDYVKELLEEVYLRMGGPCGDGDRSMTATEAAKGRA